MLDRVHRALFGDSHALETLERARRDGTRDSVDALADCLGRYAARDCRLAACMLDFWGLLDRGNEFQYTRPGTQDVKAAGDTFAAAGRQPSPEPAVRPDTGVSGAPGAADSDSAVYPGAWPRRTPEKTLLDIATTLVYMVFFPIPVYAIVESFIGGWGVGGVVIGGIFGAVPAIIVWARLHDAAWLEYSGGLLSWRGSVPWAPRMRPGRIRSIRWPVRNTIHRRHLEIELTDGRKIAVHPGYGLMEFINAVQQGDPLVRVEIRPGKWWQPGSWWMFPRPDSGLDLLAREITGYRAFQAMKRVVTALYAVGVALCALGVVTIVVLDVVGVRETFGTLRGYLAEARLPRGYHLAAQRQLGSDCRNTCSVTQTWVWVSPAPRTTSASCADAEHAMSGVSPEPVLNSPLPPGEACDYSAFPDTLFPPGQGKPTVDAIVTHTKSGQIVMRLVAAYHD